MSPRGAPPGTWSIYLSLSIYLWPELDLELLHLCLHEERHQGLDLPLLHGRQVLRLLDKSITFYPQFLAGFFLVPVRDFLLVTGNTTSKCFGSGSVKSQNIWADLDLRQLHMVYRVTLFMSLLVLKMTPPLCPHLPPSPSHLPSLYFVVWEGFGWILIRVLNLLQAGSGTGAESATLKGIDRPFRGGGGGGGVE